MAVGISAPGWSVRRVMRKEWSPGKAFLSDPLQDSGDDRSRRVVQQRRVVDLACFFHAADPIGESALCAPFR